MPNRPHKSVLNFDIASTRRAVSRCVRVALYLVLAGIFAINPNTVRADNPTAMLVLDSSKSMWGQIDGKNKVVIAREALSKNFEEFDGKFNLGIVAYGHRKSVGCQDIETVLTPRPVAGDVFKETVSTIRPRGSTPIAKSLEIAARSAGIPRVRATIVLLSDGLDNCRQDPCATARKLKAQSSALKIDVIAFDGQTQHKLEALKCVSDITGGTFYPATNAKELNDALRTSFNNIVGAKPPSSNVAGNLDGWAADTDLPDANDAKADAQEGFGKTEVLPTDLPNTTVITRAPPPAGSRDAGSISASYAFTAVLSDNGKTIPKGLIWRVYKVAKSKRAKPTLVETARLANPVFNLAPGRYLVTVTYGKAYTTLFHVARAGENKKEQIVLNAGGLRLASVLANGAPVDMDDVRYDIFTDERDQFSNRKIIMKDVAPGLIIRLNSGIYHIVSTYGDANAKVEADVTVEAGKLTEAAVNHSSGKVTFKLVRNTGGEALARTQWHVQTTDGKTVAKSIGAFPSHILAEGRYLISAQYEGNRFQESFVVKPGDNKQVEVVAQRIGSSAVPGVAPVPELESVPGVQSLDIDPSVLNPAFVAP